VGLLTTKKEELQEVARLARSIGYQLNVHAIGDATNRLVLEVMKEQVAKIPDHRWRIEHAQVVDPADLALFSELNVIPSVQPVHAVSDRHWAEKRLGKGRLKGAYAYASLLNAKGMLAIGTDFPVEHFNPFLTIQAAVYRTNADNEPIGGFLPQEAISFEDCIRGMTLWAAIAAFQENRLGTLERDKDATFVILQNALKPNPVFTPNFAHKVFVNGKLMYETA
jgi:predicted amidohydrolase YtcJ